ncbi:ABC transporter permease [Methanocella conradii]|uniref:ABC transporter permease n=1 Tax=Methanocella conradii TaxID=1175444 RepID=UPI0024B3AD4E|nr:ABC transporter permease [Methanocella conradii]MDI6896250.1 ABC transporter permease [Methanocella conradii]
MDEIIEKTVRKAWGDKFIGNVARSQLKYLGFAILLALSLMAVFAPYIAPYDPKQTGIPYQAPSLEHLLGTNDLGQDVFSELIYATRVSLVVGFLSGIISIVIGVLVGVFAGYFRGWVEELLMGTTDVFLLIPGLPLMIILAAYLNPSMWNIIIVVGLLWWCSTARLVHSRVLQVREMQFIESTRALGYSDLYIIFKHVLVNTRDIIYAKFSLAVASAMLSEASLSFLGLGDPLNVSWGEMIHFAFSRGGFANDMWWWYLPPGLMICISVLGFIMLTIEGKKDSKLLELI